MGNSFHQSSAITDVVADAMDVAATVRTVVAAVAMEKMADAVADTAKKADAAAGTAKAAAVTATSYLGQ